MSARQFARAALGAVMLATCLGVAGCVGFRTPVQPPAGWLFTSYSAPLTPSVNDTPVGRMAPRRGTRQTHYLFWPLLITIDLAWDSATIEEIAREHGIEEISYADYEFMHILGIYATFKVHVYGN